MSRNGDTEEGLVFTGENVWRIKDIPSVKELIDRLVVERKRVHHRLRSRPGLNGSPSRYDVRNRRERSVTSEASVTTARPLRPSRRRTTARRPRIRRVPHPLDHEPERGRGGHEPP